VRTTDRPLRAVRVDVITAVRSANDSGLHVDSGKCKDAKRERQREQIFRDIFHPVLLHLRQKQAPKLDARIGVLSHAIVR
jgi:hypothetical protein